MNILNGLGMRSAHLLAMAALCAAIVSPAVSQSYDFLETRDEAQRRRQAEQYDYEKGQEKRGNLLNTNKPRPLGEAPPSRFSTPRVPRDKGTPQPAPPPPTNTP